MPMAMEYTFQFSFPDPDGTRVLFLEVLGDAGIWVSPGALTLVILRLMAL